MKYLWIGKYASQKKLLEAAEKGYRDPAAYQSQSNIISAIDYYGKDLDSINAINVPFKYKDWFFQGEEWSRNGKSNDKLISYPNFGYLNNLFMTISLKRSIKKWTLINSNQNVVVFVYGMQSHLMKAATIVKNQINKSTIIQIVPDLPHFMDFKQSVLKKILKKIDWLFISKLHSKFDGYILYTHPMSNFLKIKKKPFMIFEGSIDLIQSKSKSKDFRDGLNKTVLMYSGRIEIKYGIELLLKAVACIQDMSFELWFTGFGEDVDLIGEYGKKDPRIKYLGFYPVYEDYLEVQSQATMLISMRDPNEEGSSYCFPSKILEYMLSGKIALSSKIKGIPPEYYPYLVIIEEFSPKGIAKAINNVCSMGFEEKEKLSLSSRDFVIKNKNSTVQTKKILDFVEKITT